MIGSLSALRLIASTALLLLQGWAIDFPEGNYTAEFLLEAESRPFDSSWSSKTEPLHPDGGHESDVLTIVLDFKAPGSAITSDIFNNEVSEFDVTAYGFALSDFDTVADAVLAAVDEDFFSELVGTAAGPAGKDLAIDFIRGEIGIAPPGVGEYYYVQIGSTGDAAFLGIAGTGVVRDSATGAGPNFGITTGDVVASVFTNNINGLNGVGTSLTSGNLEATKFAISGTTSHEIGHTLSILHLNKAGSTTPSGLPPIMGTGAIDLPNTDRILDREFAISGINSQMAGQSQQHIQQLVDAVSLHNIPPTAAFSFNCAALSCSFSDISTGSGVSVILWSWNFDDNGATSTDQNPSHTFSEAGTYAVSLTVTDSNDATDMVMRDVTVTVVAPNQAPVASFTFSCNDLTCMFTDSSTDPTGGTPGIASHSWDFNDNGASSTDQNPSHTFSAAGTYSVSLTVTDNDGAMNTVMMDVTVVAPNQAPVASFTFSCNDLTCMFTDSSTDPTGGTPGIASHSWDFNDNGASSTDQNPSHTFSAAGTYSVSLTVTDNDGASDTVIQSITVTPTNQPPIAAFRFACVDLFCAFEDVSLDADGVVQAWFWSFGDGGVSTQQSPTHEFGASGEYRVTLRVTDNDGATNSISQILSVSGGSSPMGSTCFSSNNLVEVKDKGHVAMDTVNIGDWLRVGGGRGFAQVYSLGHWNELEEAEFLQITVKHSHSGFETTIELTERHLLFVGYDEHLPHQKAMRAGDTKVGNFLFAEDGTPAIILRIDTVKRRGVFAPFTTSGDIVVSGILASNYAAIYNETEIGFPFSFHAIAHGFKGFHRAVCQVNFAWCRMEAYNVHGVSKWIPQWYKSFMTLSTGSQRALIYILSPVLILGYLADNLVTAMVVMVTSLSVVWSSKRLMTKINTSVEK